MTHPIKTLQAVTAEWPHYQADNLSVADAAALLSRMVQPMAPCSDNTELLSLQDCLGRILAQSVVSPVNVPPHNNAAMDGYAFNASALQSVPAGADLLQLPVVGTVLAGQVWSGSVGAGACIKIMTGAPLPPEVDTVVPFEQVSFTPTPLPRITLKTQQIKKGDHCRLLGEDMQAGAIALQQGERLTPAALGLVASLGIGQLPVLRRVRVAYFSTGNELLSLGEAPRAGAVYDSNRYTLQGLLTNLGCTVIDMGAVRDDPALLQAAFVQAAAQADVVITTGGVSTGDADVTHSFLQQLGEVLYWKLAMRPGRPMAVGRMGQALLLGLPGNPVAAMVNFLALVRPTLLRLMGARAVPLPRLQARSLEAIHKKPGRTEYVRGILSNHADGTLQVQSTGSQGSGLLSSMVHANCLMVLPPQQGHVAVADLVEVWMLQGFA